MVRRAKVALTVALEVCASKCTGLCCKISSSMPSENYATSDSNSVISLKYYKI